MARKRSRKGPKRGGSKRTMMMSPFTPIAKRGGSRRRGGKSR